MYVCMYVCMYACMYIVYVVMRHPHVDIACAINMLAHYIIMATT